MTITTSRPAGFGDADLAELLEHEDSLETAGLLARGERRTCRECRVWTSAAHLTSDMHWRAVSAAVTAAGNAAVAGIAVDAVDDGARRRLVDRLTAIALAAGTAGGLGWGAAQTPMLADAADTLPADLLWAVSGGLVGAAAAHVAWTAVRGWWADRPTAEVLAVYDRTGQGPAAIAAEAGGPVGLDGVAATSSPTGTNTAPRAGEEARDER